MQRQYFDAANVIHQQEQQPVLYAPQQTTTTTNIAQMQAGSQISEVSVMPHEMPAPTHEPWNINLMPWKLDTSAILSADGVMKFGANRNLEAEALQRRLQLHHKRKSDIMPEHPSKQFISEEKFTAHFNGLHISSDYVQHNNNPMSCDIDNIDNQPSTSGVCFTNRSYEDYQITAKELEEKLLRANRITICDEVRRMHNEQKKISLLPEALMNRIEKPCKALVLWQPSPIDILRKINVPNITDNESRLAVYADIGNNASGSKLSSSDVGLKNNLDANGSNAYDEFSDNEPDVEIDDYIDNNNTSSLDFNNLKPDGMEEDL